MKRIYTPVKPARSYEEQARRLSEIHGLEIGDPERVRRIFATRNMTQTSASKFCMCVDRLNGVMPRLSA